MKQARELAEKIIEETSFGKPSALQAVILEILLEAEGKWKRPKELIPILKNRGVLPAQGSDNTSYSMVSDGLAQLEKKLERIPTLIIERDRRFGARCISHSLSTENLVSPTRVSSTIGQTIGGDQVEERPLVHNINGRIMLDARRLLGTMNGMLRDIVRDDYDNNISFEGEAKKDAFDILRGQLREMLSKKK